MKKITNAPDRIGEEVLERMVSATHGRLVAFPGARTVARADIADERFCQRLRQPKLW